MILSTIQELRLHIPSNAVDEVALLRGVLDNSEKDFLLDKLGTALYDRLCEYYNKETTPDEFFMSITSGDYASDPWAILLLNAQRMIANDAMARYVYQQAVSINGAGVNVASSNDYAAADTKLIEKGVQGYRKEAMTSLNILLTTLETWAEQINTPAEADSTEDDTTTDTTEHDAIEEIVTLWQESRYYYLHGDLLIPTCAVLQEYLNVYDNRDKFILLLPDLRFIQDEYITDAIGEKTLADLLHSTSDTDKRLLRRVRRLMVAYLEERTQVLPIDKSRRQQAHDEAVALKENIINAIKEKQKADGDASATTDTPSALSDEGYKNNQDGTRMFVPPLLY
jgi:hypothetical protein